MKVKVEFKNVSTKLKADAMYCIKKRMIMMTDIGITKYQVIDDKLYNFVRRNNEKITIICTIISIFCKYFSSTRQSTEGQKEYIQRIL